MTDVATQDWGVAVLALHGGATAVANLNNQGFSNYRPIYREKTRQGNKSVPLFGSYIFVAISDGWRAITGTKGIGHLLLNGLIPSKAPRGFIEKLRASEDASGHIVLPKPPLRQFIRHSLGDKVRIGGDGPFQGMTGLYDGMSSRDRDFVLLSFLGTERRVELDHGDLD